MSDNKSLLSYLLTHELIHKMKLEHNLTNALVCKEWFNHIKDGLYERKRMYYDRRIYNLIVNKIYYKHDRDDDSADKGWRKIDIILYNNTLYNKMLNKLMRIVSKEKNKLYFDIRMNMLEYYETFLTFSRKFKDHSYHNNMDIDIANEYGYLLSTYFDYDIDEDSI